MDKKRNPNQAVIGVIALVSSMSTAGIGLGLLGASDAVFPVRFRGGLALLLAR